MLFSFIILRHITTHPVAFAAVGAESIQPSVRVCEGGRGRGREKEKVRKRKVEVEG